MRARTCRIQGDLQNGRWHQTHEVLLCLDRSLISIFKCKTDFKSGAAFLDVENGAALELQKAGATAARISKKYRNTSKNLLLQQWSQVETDLTFVALIGIIYPPRPECHLEYLLFSGLDGYGV